jgi:hypothetical protein
MSRADTSPACGATMAGPARAPGRSAATLLRKTLLYGPSTDPPSMENPTELLNRLDDRYRNGPWRDFAKVPCSGHDEAHLYAEIQGFFAVDDGKSFAVIQWLKPGKRARVGSFPFDSWSREVAEPATTSHPCRFEFQVVPVECITCVAFVVPNPDKVGHFWIVPPKAEWHLFHAPPKFPR